MIGERLLKLFNSAFGRLTGTSASPQNSYFHVSTIDHPIGAVLEQGSWGRTTRAFGSSRPLAEVNDAKTLAWEATLEAARRAFGSSAPSRLDCIFAAASAEDAITFRDRFRPGAHIFEIQPNKTAPIYVADYDLITGPGGAFIDTWVTRSVTYWTSPPRGMAEVLIGGSVTILRRMEHLKGAKDGP
ncbi:MULTISPECIES: DUF2441 domain-containing protein [unclassified Bradyrhizobium]|uniref:DUF2441 domain-containing protein n=1 Tax=unclassified Bradyrhizobium TaxID=2631580 RepID=UPI00211EB7E2|nr:MULTISPECIES: DUF2441 domain-containing protein [unclassified Bradyrhizobium]